MDIAGIRRLIGVLLIAVIVELADFIAPVKHRYTGEHKHIGMEHDIQTDGLLHGLFVLFLIRLFHAAHGSRGSAESGVPGNRVRIVKLAPAVAVPGIALEIII